MNIRNMCFDMNNWWINLSFQFNQAQASCSTWLKKEGSEFSTNYGRDCVTRPNKQNYKLNVAWWNVGNGKTNHRAHSSRDKVDANLLFSFMPWILTQQKCCSFFHNSLTSKRIENFVQFECLIALAHCNGLKGHICVLFVLNSYALYNFWFVVAIISIWTYVNYLWLLKNWYDLYYAVLF